MDDPLNDYLTNLEKVQALDVKVTLPGHWYWYLVACGRTQNNHGTGKEAALEGFI